MSVLHKPILKIEVWHDYFLGPDEQTTLPDDYDISEAIALIPTAECQKTLKQLRWLIRPQPYGTVLLANVTTDSKQADEFAPIVSIDTEARLTFWMVIRDRNFANYTNLPFTAPRDLLYYFTNRSGNSFPTSESAGSTPGLFLSKKLDPYTANSTYALGDMVAYQSDNGGTAGAKKMTLEATTALQSAGTVPSIITPIKNNNGTSAAADDEVSGEWISKVSSQYVSVRDHNKSQRLFRTEVLDRAGPGDTIVLTDINGSKTVVFTVPTEHPSGTQLSVQLNLSGYPPGHYQLSHLENNRQDRSTQLDEFVLCDPMASRDAFALVELSLSPAAIEENFQLLTASENTQQLIPKTYRIRFGNRATFWRYNQNRPSRTTPSPKLPDYFKRIDSKTFVTKYPFGHYRHPGKKITGESSRPLPIPSPSSTPKIQLSSNDPKTITALFSDLYI